METIDLTTLRNLLAVPGKRRTRICSTPAHSSTSTRSKLDEEHITVEYDEKITRFYNANEITHREWILNTTTIPSSLRRSAK